MKREINKKLFISQVNCRVCLENIRNLAGFPARTTDENGANWYLKSDLVRNGWRSFRNEPYKKNYCSSCLSKMHRNHSERMDSKNNKIHININKGIKIMNTLTELMKFLFIWSTISLIYDCLSFTFTKNYEENLYVNAFTWVFFFASLMHLVITKIAV